jgi:hypothetical protein
MAADCDHKGPALNRRWYGAGAALFIAADLGAAMLRRQRYAGDFDISMEFGRRFAYRQHLYQGGLHFPYLPAAAMFFSPFSMLPRPLAFLLFYLAAIICLALVMRMLAAIVCRSPPALRERTWEIAAVTLVLAAHYIIRDLDDGGPNLILLALVTGGIYWAWAGRDLRAAGFLGAATAFKATAGIFIPFLIWKRRWRLAMYTAASTLVWLALPILRMGPADWWVHQREWIESAIGFAVGLNQAAAYYYGAGNSGNQSLRTAVIHLLDGRLGISPRIAAIVAALILAAVFCWVTARPYAERMSTRWLRESSGLLLLAVLLAPIAWIQHLVVAIPALYLISADWFAGEDFGPCARASMAVYAVLALVLNRSVIGKARYQVLLEYHVQTLCMLLVLGVLMRRRNDELLKGELGAREAPSYTGKVRAKI